MASSTTSSQEGGRPSGLFCPRRFKIPRQSRNANRAANDPIRIFEESQIKSFDKLRRMYATHGIVAMDIEGWGNQRPQLVSELALTFLPPLNTTTSGTPPPPPKRFRSLFTQTYSISVVGRRPPVRGKREALMHGPFLSTPPEDVEDAMIKILEKFVSNLSPRPPLILTGYSMGTEVATLQYQYPRVMPYFSAWTDMQRHFMGIVTVRNCRSSNYSVGHQDALSMLGYDNDSEAVHHYQHRAGNDNARTVAVFLHLLDRAGSGAENLIFDKTDSSLFHQTTKIRHVSHKLFSTRPYPIEAYPFAAKLTCGGEVIHGPVSIMRLFRQFEIVALGLLPAKEQPRFCWICFRTREMLEQFVQHVLVMPDKVHKDGSVSSFQAEMLPLPDVETRTADEMEVSRRKAFKEWDDSERAMRTAAHRAAEQAGAEKRKERQREARKAEEDLEEEGYCIPWGGDAADDMYSEGETTSWVDCAREQDSTTEDSCEGDGRQTMEDQKERTEALREAYQESLNDMGYLLRLISMLEADGY